MQDILIGDSIVGENQPTFIIAEAGNNHNNDIDIAKELIDAAAAAGADAVKFQLSKAKDTYVETSGSVEYLNDEREIFDIVEEMELPETWIPELQDYCMNNNILFLTTPFDRSAVDLLEDYVSAYKIASYSLSHHPFLKHVANTGKPVIMSTGAHNLDEIREAVSVLRTAGVSDLILLQCVASYPTPLDSINVRVIKRLREEFDTHVGLSDHTTDPTTAPTATVALGGRVIEKHFTLDRSLEGPDHSFALEPDELDEMITAIRKTEAALGSAEKCILDVEAELEQMAKRGIQAARNINSGETITEDDVAILRPGNRNRGIKPKYYSQILGATAVTDIEEDAGIDWDDLTVEKPE